jgi:hypothetical protein
MTNKINILIKKVVMSLVDLFTQLVRTIKTIKLWKKEWDNREVLIHS